jgi:hypothetical protein
VIGNVIFEIAKCSMIYSCTYMYRGCLLSWRDVMLKRSEGRETGQRLKGEPPGSEDFAVVDSDDGWKDRYLSSTRGI